MLSVPHMIVVFVVVLVVFGPQKLPELARTFGKLMAEFRKASNDFKSAFEEEMRDLERQARIAELKKQVAEATAAADAALRGSANPVNPAPTPASTKFTEAEATVSRTPAETVPRLDGGSGETEAAATTATATAGEVEPEPATENRPSNDQQQPA